MTGAEIDPDGRYPEGYTPGWWRCPECGGYFHDIQDVGDSHMVAWDLPVECNGPCGGVEMKRVSDGPPDQRPGAIPFRCPSCGEQGTGLLLDAAGIFASPTEPVIRCAGCDATWRVELFEVAP